MFLNTYVEKQAENAECLSFCSGIKVLHIRRCVEEMLGYIGKGGIFEEYTLHSIKHIDEMFKIVEWLIPDETKERMTYAEWLMLTLAIYFHDLGMVVTKDEFAKRNRSSFNEYKKRVITENATSEYGDYVNKQDDHFLYQEFVRENHAKRVRLWIEGNEEVDFGDSITVREEIRALLEKLDVMFRKDLALICESHHEDDIDDFSKYKTSVSYGNGEHEKVNLNYVAIILRIADLLHITRDRTPSISRKMINVSNPVSVIEWEKQSAVRAVQAKAPRNEEGHVDKNIEKDTIEITAYFDGADTAEAYFGLSAYLQYAQKELEKCSLIVEKAEKTEGTTGYKFPWKYINEENITAVGFETKKLQFTIAQENILQLLVGHTLYNDSSVVVRELVQNAIDAVKLQKKYDEKNGKTITEGRIDVYWNEQKRELSFLDNGTGMTMQDVEKYLLKVGASKYRDDFIKKEFPDFSSISHFGIGILTCFMVANDIDIVTNSEDQEDVNIINLRKVNGNYLLKKVSKSTIDERIRKHGTMVRLHIRNDINMDGLEDDLKKWIVVPEVPVFYKKGEIEVKIGYDSLKDVLVQYLNEIGRTVDGEKYDVFEKTHGNITVAYAIRHHKYLSDWCLVGPERKINRNKILPIGTCVEGIRVEFSTPGYKDTPILAIANIKNSKYQTNVARSALELDGNKEILSNIYDVYKNYVQEQMELLERKKYSKSWALMEGSYLMKPLVADDYSTRVQPVDEDILTERLAQLKCIILENEGERKIISAAEVDSLSEINIFECKMVQAAENLLKEIRCEATLQNVLDIVYEGDNFLKGVKNVICNYNQYNILHQYALKNKEAVKITINRENRRIHITYADANDRWYKFEMRGGRYLYVAKEEFTIEGISDEIGVNTVGGIYVGSTSAIYSYITKIIKTFLVDDTDENRRLLDVFLTNIFDSRVLEKTYKKRNPDKIFRSILSEKYMGIGDDLLEKMWSMIDVEEFTKTVLTKNFHLYSINNWSRGE